MKSNSSTTPFVTVPFAITFKTGSVETFDVAGVLLVKLPDVFGPIAPTPFPVVKRTPFGKGNEGIVGLSKEVTLPITLEAFARLPFTVMFEREILIVVNWLFNKFDGVKILVTVI